MRYVEESGYYVNRHSCFLLQYHLVLVTKYRHPVLTGEVKDALEDYTRRYFKDRGLVIQALDIEPDHLHVLFDAGPQLELTSFVNAFKSGSSRRLRSDFPDEVSKFYWKPVFWSLSYFICSVSDRFAAAVKRYIENQ